MAALYFEDLPDELILMIYKFLSNIHILYSFYSLNLRFSRTCYGFIQHLTLTPSPLREQTRLYTHILSQIGSHVQKLTIISPRASLHQNLFLTTFASNFGTTFSNLRELFLVYVQNAELTSYLEMMKEHAHIESLSIRCIHPTTREDQVSILPRILENVSLRKVKFDVSYPPFLIIEPGRIPPCPHILELSVRLDKLESFFELVKVIPAVHRLSVSVSTTDRENSMQPIPVLPHLANFTFSHFNMSSADLKTLLPSFFQLLRIKILA